MHSKHIEHIEQLKNINTLKNILANPIIIITKKNLYR